MPGTEFLRDQLARERERAEREQRRGDRERRRGNWSYGIMLVAVVTAIVAGYLAFRADNRANKTALAMSVQHDNYVSQLEREREINDTCSQRITRLWGLNAQLLGSLVWERRQAGSFEARSIRTGRQANDLREDVKRLRSNWTSELGIKP